MWPCRRMRTSPKGPVWDAEDGMLWWVDIFRGEVHRFDPSSRRDETFQSSAPVGSRWPCAPAAGCSWRCATVSMPGNRVICRRRWRGPSRSAAQSVQRRAHRSTGAVLGRQPASAGDRADRRLLPARSGWTMRAHGGRHLCLQRNGVLARWRGPATTPTAGNGLSGVSIATRDTGARRTGAFSSSWSRAPVRRTGRSSTPTASTG